MAVLEKKHLSLPPDYDALAFQHRMMIIDYEYSKARKRKAAFFAWHAAQTEQRQRVAPQPFVSGVRSHPLRQPSHGASRRVRRESATLSAEPGGPASV